MKTLGVEQSTPIFFMSKISILLDYQGAILFHNAIIV